MDNLTNPDDVNLNIQSDNSDSLAFSHFKEMNRFYAIFVRIRYKIKNYILSLKYTHQRMNLMKTPCNHLFHNICLEKWLEFKNECPYCRREIPPLE